MTIGDIVAVIAAIAAIAATWAATILACALLFPAKAEAARERIVNAPGRVFLRGVLTTAVVLIAAAIVNHSHSGPTRILAGMLICALLLISAVGGAGIVRLIAGRMQPDGEAGYAVLGRSTGLYVAMGFLPVVGWFVIAPLALFFSVGAASGAILTGRKKPAPVSQPAPPAFPATAEPTP